MYDLQVIRAMNNSEENVLAFAGNISTQADSHLVCIQSTQDDTSYTTQAINIHNKPRQGMYNFNVSLDTDGSGINSIALRFHLSTQKYLKNNNYFICVFLPQ